MADSVADPHRSTAPASFYEWAVAQPERPAFIEADGATATFGELGVKVNRLSNALRARGLEVGQRIAVQLPNGIDYLELALAAGQIGVVLVPVSTQLSAMETEYILADSEARMVVTDAQRAAALDRLDVGRTTMRVVAGGVLPGWQDFDELSAGSSASAPAQRVAGNNMGYTSGTSGRPKGVIRPVAHLTPEESVARILGFLGRFGLLPGPGIHLICSPLYHAAPYAFAYGSLHLGQTLVCLPRFDASRVLAAIERFGVTSSHMVPTHFQRLLALTERERAARDVSSMRLLVHAGAPCPDETKRKMLAWFGPIVWEYYGATEGTVSIASPADALAKPGTVGRPLPSVDVKVMDGSGHALPPDEQGTIYFTAATGQFAYHGDEAKTQQSRHGMYSTVGDVGWLDGDGYLFLGDRREDLINSGGVNVYPAEVEQRLLEHPLVADAAVVGQPDDEWGERVVAFVRTVAGTDEGPELAERLRTHCRAGIASLKCPRVIHFRAHLPRTETGKLLRRVLRDELAETEKENGL